MDRWTEEQPVNCSCGRLREQLRGSKPEEIQGERGEDSHRNEEMHEDWSDSGNVLTCITRLHALPIQT